MATHYQSIEAVRLAAARSLGFSTTESIDTASFGPAIVVDTNLGDGMTLAAPIMPDESAVRAAEEQLASITRSLVEEEASRLR